MPALKWYLFGDDTYEACTADGKVAFSIHRHRDANPEDRVGTCRSFQVFAMPIKARDPAEAQTEFLRRLLNTYEQRAAVLRACEVIA